MNEKLLTDFYSRRGYTEEAGKRAVDAVKACKDWLAGGGTRFEEVGLGELRAYLDLLIEENRNHEEDLLALARYCYLSGKTDLYIYFTSILGVSDIISNIADHTEAVLGTEVRNRVFSNLKIPPLGSPPEAAPQVTREMVERLLEEVSEADCRKALTCNAHGIPESAFEEEKKYFADAPSLEEYLADRHRRQVAVLEEHARTGKAWFEQRITPRVVDYVREHPEVQGGVVRDGKIYITKIPYDPDGWLEETDSKKRRYLACHCPMARASLKDGNPVPPIWCNCSAGFGKLMFDALYGQTLEAEALETVLGGNEVCRFAIRIPEQE